MAFLGESFDIGSMPDGKSYDLVPEGWYKASIVKADLKDTTAGTGKKIDVRFDITGPTHQGRAIFTTINIRNPSQRAEEIGRQQLGEIMRAIGLSQVQDSDQLIGGQLQIKVKVREPSAEDKAKGYTDSRNEVAGYKSASASVTPSITAPASPAPSAAPKAPWEI